MKYFKDLYNFLISFEGDITEWLKIPWIGKDKQESLLRLFAGLKLIDKLENYNMCKGNFNLKTIETHESFKDVFYNNHKLIFLKDKGDSSDLINKKKYCHMFKTIFTTQIYKMVERIKVQHLFYR